MVKVSAHRLDPDRALVKARGRDFVVEQRTREGRNDFCPVELVAAALAS